MSLVAHDVEFSYQRGVRVLDGWSIAVEPGERVALCAPSGRGKTTACRILSGYLSPQAGSVTVDGSSADEPGSRSVQLIWQHPELAFDPGCVWAARLPKAGLTCRGMQRSHARAARGCSRRSASGMNG